MPAIPSELLFYSVIALVAVYPFLVPAFRWAKEWLEERDWEYPTKDIVNHLLLVAVLVMGVLLYRANSGGGFQPVRPDAPTVPGLAGIAQRMTATERQGMAEAYLILSRSIAANPADEPVFASTQSVREAHRAALLCVWRGLLDNNPGKYPGLREELEGELQKRIGLEDVPLTPTLQEQAAKAFADIATAFGR